jgi:hypothetical protein
VLAVGISGWAVAAVLLIDAGPRFDPSIDYPLTEADWDGEMGCLFTARSI